MKAKVMTTQFVNNKRVFDVASKVFISDTNNQECDIINLYPQVKYQKIEGFGGAITEAVGVTLKQMSTEVQQEIIQEYFSPDGMGYDRVRTHLDSCDFSLSNYSAIDNADDEKFNTFSLARDEESIIPYLEMANTVSGKELSVMLTPWSPPAFMKTNGKRNGGGKLRKEYYSAWALYICHYINEYKRRGICVSSLSIQNEPNATQKWDSCVFSANEERTFLKEYLYPALRTNGLHNLDVYIWDHNKERMFDRTDSIIDDETDEMIDGVAFHWYSGDHFDSLALVRQKYPDKKLLFSEGCIEYSRFDAKNELQNAQMYAHDMIGNFKNGMNTFIDWNILLDETGGPNHANNFCEAPIICDTENGTYTKKLSFYYIEHFSRYIKPDATCIATTQFTDKIETVAFQNPNGSIVMVILNRQKDVFDTYLRLNDKLLNISILGESICTVDIELG